jgi:aspartyl-tRNA(Asn)/glutamyl-tRNA(Gln) amidotransferase subunit B
MNSFRYVERALEFEINRQIHVLEEGGRVIQETLLWDANLGVASPMRTKEEAHDYRYFPDPDLVPVVVDEPWKATVRETLPELPAARRDRFIRELNLPKYDADLLTVEKPVADYFEATVGALANHTGKQPLDVAKVACNWVMTEVLRVVSEKKIDMASFPISPLRFATMIRLILDGTISGTIAKEVFEQMLSVPDEPAAIVQAKGLAQVSDVGLIEQAIQSTLADNQPQVEKYLKGNEKVFGFFVGETMKRLRGKGNPGIINDLIRKQLNALKTS